MLFIEYCDAATGEPKTLSVRTGAYFIKHKIHPSDIVRIMVNGEELEAVYKRKLYPHKPILDNNNKKMKGVWFYGDMAAFIIGNL